MVRFTSVLIDYTVIFPKHVSGDAMIDYEVLIWREYAKAALASGVSPSQAARAADQMLKLERKKEGVSEPVPTSRNHPEVGGIYWAKYEGQWRLVELFDTSVDILLFTENRTHPATVFSEWSTERILDPEGSPYP